MQLSVVIPCFNEELNVAPLQEACVKAFEGKVDSYELIFVNDGSRDKTFSMAKEIQEKDKRVVVVDFARNFGHQIAVTAGLDQAKGDAVVIIDADLQDPPELIPKMVEMWKNGAEVVYGKRISRKGETFFKKITAFAYYRILDWLSGWKIPKDTGDFRLMDKKVADVMRSMHEPNRFLRGMVAGVGFRPEPIEFVREERFAGETKYTLKKMLRLATDGIISFSGRPFGVMRWGGGALLNAGLLLALALVIALFFTAVEGWLWVLAAVLVTGGLNLIALGICGIYFERMYDELKGRPLYIVRDVHRKE